MGSKTLFWVILKNFQFYLRSNPAKGEPILPQDYVRGFLCFYGGYALDLER